MKTVEGQPSGGSNPSLSANYIPTLDLSRPTKTQLNQAVSKSANVGQSVPIGLQQSPLRHKFATSLAKRSYETLLSELAPLASYLALRFAKTLERYDYDQAHQELNSIHQRLCLHDLNLCASSEELKQKARQYAWRCQGMRQAVQNPIQAYQQVQQWISRYGVIAPSVKDEDYAPALSRLTCEKWWFRQLKVLRLRTIGDVARSIEVVSRCRQTYVSDHLVTLKRQQKEQNRFYLSSTFITNELGQRYALQDLADRSVSNPAIRRAELMVRIKGFEVVANLLGHVGEFYTLTTPSRMHACLHHGQINPQYDGTTVREAQTYLTHLWALIRAELHRQGIRPYGFRVVEPHHDGTPHWHLLLFMPPDHQAQVKATLKHYALLDSPDEKGAQEHRFKAVSIEPSKGSAAGYIAKYIAKNIDGYGLSQEPDQPEASQVAERINTWATAWGIRQFQQIGGPSVSVWRQLRRLEAQDDEVLEPARQAATASDWAAFTLAMGGIELPRREHPIKPYYDYPRQLKPHTGEIIFTTRNRYGDEASRPVVGLESAKGIYDARKHFWTVTREADASRATIPLRAGGAAESSSVSVGKSAAGVPLDSYQ